MRGDLYHEAEHTELIHSQACGKCLQDFAFWLMAHLVCNPCLLEQIREEVLPAVKADNTVDETYLSGHCPKLDSLDGENA